MNWIRAKQLIFLFYIYILYLYLAVCNTSFLNSDTSQIGGVIFIRVLSTEASRLISLVT